jgi:hypothetical protein
MFDERLTLEDFDMIVVPGGNKGAVSYRNSGI